MPELPEVETVVREIRPKIVGRVIQTAKAGIARQVVGLTPARFATKLKGAHIKSVSRRGKYIVIGLDRGTLLIHLRMTGQLYVRNVEAPEHSHERAWLVLDSGKKILVFRDVRTLGTLHFFEPQQVIAPLEDMGWEPLEVTVSGRQFKEALQKRSMAIKPVLLDQRIWAGIGNIYASEALWLAGINPRRKANKLSLRECERLIAAIKRTLERALEKGGSTLRDFMSPEGNAGEYSGEFRVYDRAGEPCFKCKTAIRRIVQAQRSTYYCPCCQKK